MRSPERVLRSCGFRVGVLCRICDERRRSGRESPGALEIFANVYAVPVSLVLIVCWSLHQHVISTVTAL
jgi:hypothetical protein